MTLFRDFTLFLVFYSATISNRGGAVNARSKAMRLNRFDLNLLIALDALLRERSVTRAAGRVFISQPAMSAALARLREYFQDPLLVRAGRDLELTPRGRSLIGPVQQMLVNAHAVLGSYAVFDPSLDQRTFTVLCPEQVTPWLMPAVLGRLQQWAPGIKIQLERPSVATLARFSQAGVDLLIAIDATESLPYPVLPELSCSSFVTSIRYVGLVSRQHPQVPDQLTTELFLRLPHVVVRGSRQRSPVEEAARKRFGVELEVRATAESVLELPHLIGTTSLIGVVPEQLASTFSHFPGIKVLQLPDGAMPFSRLDLMWHRYHEPDPGHAWMRNLFLSESVNP